MSGEMTPRVGIGLPVYNGENFLVEALDSILAQTFEDWGLVICDNASTDRTGEISRDYAARDRRIVYSCAERNLGAAPNFNRAFELSSGEYFRWHCHDDLMAPDYIERCVAAMDADPGSAVCHSLVKLIDERGECLDIHDSNLVGADSSRPSTRFGALAVRPHQVTDLDGLIRSECLARTRLVESFHGSDRSLLCELALLGRFLQVKEPLFMTREHPDRYRRAVVSPEERLAFHDTSRSVRFTFPTWRLLGSYLGMVRRHVDRPGDRLLCYAQLVRWLPSNWNWARMIVDVIAAVNPGALIWAERLKQRLFSPEPGPQIKK